jgi:nanoRNase/pAp phosphatase (c-di-AMP/oligoRNAs hydrolase)
MNEQKQHLVEKLKVANNILVTVRNNPSVDQLSACIGLTLLLNKLNKHATAVFSGDIPSTMEFLKPEETIEKNTDSLRDFIIALDKSKADKLRYKVEDKTVKIFITPYKTSISQKDLDFSQGDFNVDVVVALGAHEQQELDQAITEHGRILHDAAVVSINNSENGSLGSINWQDTTTSSLSEMVMQLSKDLGKEKDKSIIDEQIATALLTGIVAETDRFSNARTTSETMSVSAELMAAGANQQLVATKLEEALAIPTKIEQNGSNGTFDKSKSEEISPKLDDGTLEIAHVDAIEPTPQVEEIPAPTSDDVNLPFQAQDDELPHIKQMHQHEPMLPTVKPQIPTEIGDITGLGFMGEQPSGNMLTANTEPEGLDPALDQLGMPKVSNNTPLLNHDGPPATVEPVEEVVVPAETSVIQPPTPTPEPVPEPDLPANPSFTAFTEPTTPMQDKEDTSTLIELEKLVNSTHLGNSAASSDLDSARGEVLKALEQAPSASEPIAALNAQPLGNDLHPDDLVVTPEPNTELHIDQNGNIKLPQFPRQPLPPAGPVNEPAPNPMSPADQPMDMPLPPSISLPPPQTTPPTNTQNLDPNAPPPVPPPMMPFSQ